MKNMQHELKYAPNCDHDCTSNCRHVGCNCECGEFHGYYEPEEEEPVEKNFSEKQLATIAAIEKACADAGCDDEHKCNA